MPVIVNKDSVLLDLVTVSRLYELSLLVDLVYYGSCVDCWTRNDLNKLLAIHHSQINRPYYIKAT
jgi:hypothetical protein